MEQVRRERSPEPPASQKIGVFVAWPYSNGPRHLGHGASLVPGDVIARYHRSMGNDVLMVSGTDEYGTPNMIAAEQAGLPPQDYVDRTSEQIREDFIDLGMSFDWFSRTTSTEHATTAQRFFSKLVDEGYIDKGTMLGAFDQETGQALPDRYVEGGCPHCQASSRGDQCDNCSNLLEPTELINPVSKITNNPVEFLETEHYFLRLDKLAGDVIGWLEHNDNLRPNAKSSSIDMARHLRPRAITRDMNWGIPIPEGYELDGADEKVLYVWFEAVTGYLSASIEWAEHTGDPDRWKEWWQNSKAQNFYAMGKDNVPFHTLIWPAMIAAANKSGFSDGELRQPDVIASTEYLTFNEEKLSSSRGNVVYIRDLLEMVGPDAMRYYFIAAGPETRDTNFSFHELSRRINDELIAKWGNLVSRSSALIQKNHDGKIPEVGLESLDKGDVELLDKVNDAYSEIGALLNGAKFSAALKKALETATLVNKYIFDTEPWEVVKINHLQADKNMFVVMTAIQNINTILSPFLPHASQKVHEMFGNDHELTSQPVSKLIDTVNNFSVLTGDYRTNQRHWSFALAKGGQKIGTIDGHLFKKVKESELIDQFEAIAVRRKLGNLATKHGNDTT